MVIDPSASVTQKGKAVPSRSIPERWRFEANGPEEARQSDR
jgi:hypothetical protein